MELKSIPSLRNSLPGGGHVVAMWRSCGAGAASVPRWFGGGRRHAWQGAPPREVTKWVIHRAELHLCNFRTYVPPGQSGFLGDAWQDIHSLGGRLCTEMFADRGLKDHRTVVFVLKRAAEKRWINIGDHRHVVTRCIAPPLVIVNTRASHGVGKRL